MQHGAQRRDASAEAREKREMSEVRERAESACMKIVSDDRAPVELLAALRCLPSADVSVARLPLGDFLVENLAEREGFEPPVPFRGTAVFETAAFDHSAISPCSSFYPSSSPAARRGGQAEFRDGSRRCRRERRRGLGPGDRNPGCETRPGVRRSPFPGAAGGRTPEGGRGIRLP